MLEKLLKTYGTPLTLKKDDILFSAGEYNQNLFYIKSGLVKAYYITYEGKEFIKSFLKESEMLASLSSCTKNSPSTFSVMALEDCELIKISFETFKKNALQSPELSEAVLNFLTELAYKKEEREFELLSLNAEARYKRLLEKFPEFAQRITLSEIAKYLGITNVALSRIRKSINSHQ